jgi:hypothetical protein
MLWVFSNLSSHLADPRGNIGTAFAIGNFIADRGVGIRSGAAGRPAERGEPDCG